MTRSPGRSPIEFHWLRFSLPAGKYHLCAVETKHHGDEETKRVVRVLCDHYHAPGSVWNDMRDAIGEDSWDLDRCMWCAEKLALMLGQSGVLRVSIAEHMHSTARMPPVEPT